MILRTGIGDYFMSWTNSWLCSSSLAQRRSCHLLIFCLLENRICLDSPPDMWFELPCPKSACGAQSVPCPWSLHKGLCMESIWGLVWFSYGDRWGALTALFSAARYRETPSPPPIMCFYQTRHISFISIQMNDDTTAFLQEGTLSKCPLWAPLMHFWAGLAWAR